jgi:hypothetical protein
MSADKNPTTIAALMAERDRKIANRNAVRGSARVDFLVQIRGCDLLRGKKSLMRESREVHDLQSFPVIDCNGYMKFSSAHCGRR